MGIVGQTYRLADGEFLPGDILQSEGGFCYTFVSLKTYSSGEFESAILSPHFSKVKEIPCIDPDRKFKIKSRFSLEISQQ